MHCDHHKRPEINTSRSTAIVNRISSLWKSFFHLLANPPIVDKVKDEFYTYSVYIHIYIVAVG